MDKGHKEQRYLRIIRILKEEINELNAKLKCKENAKCKEVMGNHTRSDLSGNYPPATRDADLRGNHPPARHPNRSTSYRNQHKYLGNPTRSDLSGNYPPATRDTDLRGIHPPARHPSKSTTYRSQQTDTLRQNNIDRSRGRQTMKRPDTRNQDNNQSRPTVSPNSRGPHPREDCR